MGFTKKEYPPKLFKKKQILEGSDKQTLTFGSLNTDLQDGFTKVIDYTLNNTGYWYGNDKDIINKSIQALAAKATNVISNQAAKINQAYDETFNSLKPNLLDLDEKIKEYNNTVDALNQAIEEKMRYEREQRLKSLRNKSESVPKDGGIRG